MDVCMYLYLSMSLSLFLSLSPYRNLSLHARFGGELPQVFFLPHKLDLQDSPEMLLVAAHRHF